MSPTGNSRSSSFTDTALLSRAVWDSVLKLDPRKMWKNPVMFVVEVGAVAATIDLTYGVMHHADGFAFSLQITIWLWFTLLFANFETGQTLQLSGTAVVEWVEPGAAGDDGGTGRRVRFTPHGVVAGTLLPARSVAE